MPPNQQDIEDAEAIFSAVFNAIDRNEPNYEEAAKLVAAVREDGRLTGYTQRLNEER